MPTFATSGPITVNIELGLGTIRIVAGDRTDTTVEVRPTNASKHADVTAAEQVRVDYDGGRLSVSGPRGWRQYAFRGGGSVDVEIALPAGSDVRGSAGAGSLRCTGRLGECSLKTGAGSVHLDQAGTVHVRAGAGDVVVDQSVGSADIATGSGAVRIGRIDGAATIKNANGETWVGEVTGDLQVKSANGRISVDRLRAAVVVKTANGDIRLGEIARGAAVAETAFGTVTIGIREGVAAWLDLNTHFGNVRNELGSAERPWPGESTVEVKARTAFGDIVVRRSPAADARDTGDA